MPLIGSRAAGLAAVMVCALALTTGCQSGMVAGQAQPASGSTGAGGSGSGQAVSGPRIPISRVGTVGYLVALDHTSGVVTVGPPNAKVTVDLYEDLLCPICGEFESAFYAKLDSALSQGGLRVRYHLLNLLDANSVPSGYSLLAANAVLAVAAVAPGKFPDYHRSLFAKQPKEEGKGYTAEQLIDLANRLGVTDPQFAGMVTGGRFNGQIRHNLASASTDPALQQLFPDGSKGFGTPTVVANGQIINWSADPNWLTTLLGS